VTFIWPKAVAAEEFAAKVMESRVAYLKATGAYTDAEAAAVEEFKAAFKSHSLAPGASVLFTHSLAGVLTVSIHPRTPISYDGFTCGVSIDLLHPSIQVAISDDSSAPGAGIAAIENKPLCEAVLESIIGEHSISPATKQSIATRVPEILKGGA